MSPGNSTAAEAVCPIGSAPALCPLFVLFLYPFLPLMDQTPFLTDCFHLIPTSLHSPD